MTRSFLEIFPRVSNVVLNVFNVNNTKSTEGTMLVHYILMCIDNNGTPPKFRNITNMISSIKLIMIINNLIINNITNIQSSKSSQIFISEDAFIK